MADTSTPLNQNDTLAPNGATNVVTINPGDTITNGVQYYNLGGTTYQNSQYQAPFGANATSTSPVATDSGPYGNKVGNLGTNINNASANPLSLSTGASNVYGTNFNYTQDPQYQAGIAQAQAEQKAQETQLQLERDQAIQSLQSQQTTDTANLKQTQADETGTTNRNLLYMQQGGQSASAQSYLNKLADTHTTEMTALSAKYTTAIQQAQNAYTDKDFALAQSYATQAKSIQDDALKRNQDFINNTLAVAKDQRDQTQQDYTMQKDARDYATSNGIQKPFYTIDGKTLISTQTGQVISTTDQYKALGGKGDYSDVQQVDNQKFGPGIIGEYQYYVKSMTDEGLKPVDFNTYQNIDANRKRAVTNVYNSGPDSSAEVKAVQAVVDAHPGNGAIGGHNNVANGDAWDAAAKSLDDKFGAGTATKYDALLKQTYLLPAQARSLAQSMPANASLSTWQAGRQLFIQQSNYVDPDTAGAMYDKTVPKPGANSSIDAQATINQALSGQ